MRLDRATLYFGRNGRGMLLSPEGEFCIPVDCNDATWTRHLELKVCIMRHRVEFCERGSSEQSVIATAERDDIKGQVFASEVVR